MRNKIHIILYSCIIAILMIACSSSTSEDPNIVLQEFFKHLAKRDIDGASKYVTTNSKPTLQMMKKGLEMAEKVQDSLPGKDIMKDFESVTYEPAEIMGDSAFITVSSNNRDVPNATFKLLKERNGWKVDFTMSTLMKMGTNTMKEAGNDIRDTIKAKGKELQKGMELADSVLKNIDSKVLDEVQKKLENLK